MCFISTNLGLEQFDMKLLLVILVLRYIKNSALAKSGYSHLWAELLQNQTDLPDLVTCACKISSFHCFASLGPNRSLRSCDMCFTACKISSFQMIHSPETVRVSLPPRRAFEKLQFQYFFIIYQPTGLQSLPNITRSLRNFANISTQSV